MILIHKFGGTSLGDAARLASVADLLVEERFPAGITELPDGGRGAQAIVVVSAMSGVTNQLIAGARAAAEGRDPDYRTVKNELLARHLGTAEELLAERPARLEIAGLIEDRLHALEQLYRSIAVLGEVTRRGYDAVASFGEWLSASLLAAALQARGRRAQALSATELIVTDQNFGAAHPLLEPTRQRLQARLVPSLESGLIPVVTGYIGATLEGVTTTLGRGGSDYSAALIGASLEAAAIWIWSDVDGILTADPNLVPEATSLPELSYREAADLAYYGAEVLHPKTIQPVIASSIPLRLLNSFNPSHPGTLIWAKPVTEVNRLPAIISTTELALITIGSRNDAWSAPQAAAVLQCLGEAGVEVPLFSQSFAEHSLNLVVREADRAHCLRLLCAAFPGLNAPACSESVAQPVSATPFWLETREQVATISVAGVAGWNRTGLIAHTFAALGKLDTRVIAIAQPASEHSISFCIPASQVASTVRGLHRELGLDTPPKIYSSSHTVVQRFA